MDSSVNWGSFERARLRQVSPPWGSNGPLGGSVNISNFDQSFNFSGSNIARNCELYAAQVSDYRGLSPESQFRNHGMLTSTRSIAPTPSPMATGEFGYWKPVYDEKSNPAISLTGTEIWAVHTSDATQPGKNSDEWNPASCRSLPGYPKDGGNVLGNSNGVNDARLSGKSSDTQILSRLADHNINHGWGRTSVCQEKPWDLPVDDIVMESSAVPPPVGLQCESNSLELDLDLDSPLSVLKAIVASGEPFGVAGARQLRQFERSPQADVPQSSEVDGVRLLLELQRLGSSDAAPHDGFNRSRRGSSVSSVDGTPHSSAIGGKDCGYESLGNVQLWTDKQRMVHKDEWNHGSTTRMSSGMQSPSGWSSVSGSEKASVVDDGTSVWGKQPVPEKPVVVVEDGISWARLLNPKADFPPPVSAFNIDVSIPPPALNAYSVLLPGAAPHPMSRVGNLHPSGNYPGRQMNTTLPLMTPFEDRGFISPDFNEKLGILQGPQQYSQFQHLKPKPWTGNQWSGPNAWSSVQRMNSGISQNRVPLTRSKLIQQFVTLGFKREDAQNALITNNMDTDKALAELIVKHRAAMAQAENSVGHAERSQQFWVGSRDLLQGSVSGRPIGGASFSNGGAASDLDFSRLLNSRTEWSSHLSNPAQMPPSVVNLSSMLPPVSPQSIYQPRCPPGFHQNVVHADPLAPGIGDFSQGLSELMPWKNLAGNARNNFPPFDAELLKIFGRQVSSDPQNHPEEAGASTCRPNRASSRNAGIDGDFVGVTSAQSSFLAVNSPQPGSMFSSQSGSLFSSQPGSLFPSQSGSLFPSQSGSLFSSQPGSLFSSQPGSLFSSAAADPNGVITQERLNLDGFESRPLPSAGRPLSGAVAAAPGDVTPSADKSLVVVDSRRSSPDVASSKHNLPSALKIKEFIPGVPWKGAPVDASALPEVNEAPRSTSKSAAMVFKDMVTCLAKGNEAATQGKQENSVPDRLKSSSVRLRNVSDKLDGDALQTLSTTLSEVKVFGDAGEDSGLLSCASPGDAVKALDDLPLGDEDLTAEHASDRPVPDDDLGAATSSADTSQESLGYMTPNGLWIPTSSDVAPPYRDPQDRWYEEAQPAEDWRQSGTVESFPSSVCEEPGDGGSQ